MVFGSMTRHTGSVCIGIRMARYMRGCGRKTCRMEGGRSRGQMEASMKESISRGGSRGSGHICGTMGLCTKGSGTIIRLKESEYTGGSMAGSMRECGIKTIWRAAGHTSGVMEDSIKDSIRMIRSTGSGYTPGQMGDSMKDIGIKESNMGLDCIIIPKMAAQRQGCGRTASALSGFLMMKSTRSTKGHSITVIYF